MKICIYGAGAVGGHFAVKLARAGEDISVIARGPNLEAIQKNGLKLLVGTDTFQAHVRATDDPAQIGTQDVVIVTLKGPSLPGIIDHVKALLGDETSIVFAMNGIPWWYFYGFDAPGRERRIDILDPGNRWWDEIGPKRAIGGVIYSANMVVEPGVVRGSSPVNRLRIGEPDGSISERCKRINEALMRAGLADPEIEDIRQVIWSKLLNVISFSPVCTLTSSSIADVLSDTALRTISANIMKETVAVAAALGTKIDFNLEERMEGMRRIAGHKPAMVQDFELGRPIEIPSILLTPQVFARLTGVATPTLDTLIALLKQRARSAGLYSE
jgi:2-dehydropantoate 2-reductase